MQMSCCKMCGSYFYGAICHCVNSKRPKKTSFPVYSFLILFCLFPSLKPKQHIIFGSNTTPIAPPPTPINFSYSHIIPSTYAPTLKTPPISQFKPFSPPQTFITCPYISCMANMLSSQFTNHVLTNHVHNKDQQYTCPLCTSPGKKII